MKITQHEDIRLPVLDLLTEVETLADKGAEQQHANHIETHVQTEDHT
jgi:hypothetical protein